MSSEKIRTTLGLPGLAGDFSDARRSGVVVGFLATLRGRTFFTVFQVVPSFDTRMSKEASKRLRSFPSRSRESTTRSIFDRSTNLIWAHPVNLAGIQLRPLP